MYGAAHLLMIPVFALGYYAAAVVGFAALAVLQNFWRPTLIARLASRTESKVQATVLSIESQSRSLFVAVVAPLMGYAVDKFKVLGEASGISASFSFLPIALAGVVVSAAILLSGRRRNDAEEEGFDTAGEKTV